MAGTADHEALQAVTEGEHRRNHDRQRRVGIDAEPRVEEEHAVERRHQQRAVGEVDDVQHPVDEREAERATFTDVTGYSWSFAPLTLLGDEPQMLRQTLVTPNFLEVLSVRPALGQPRFDDPGTGDREVMLSHRLWTQRFGSDPAIVGRRVMFEDGPRQVVGVLAPDFFFPAPNQILMPDVLTVLDAATPKPDRWI